MMKTALYQDLTESDLLVSFSISTVASSVGSLLGGAWHLLLSTETLLGNCICMLPVFLFTLDNNLLFYAAPWMITLKSMSTFLLQHTNTFELTTMVGSSLLSGGIEPLSRAIPAMHRISKSIPLLWALGVNLKFITTLEANPLEIMEVTLAATVTVASSLGMGLLLGNTLIEKEEEAKPEAG